MEGPVCIRAGQELGFLFPPIILEESRISDCIDVGVPRGSVRRFLEVGVMAGGVGGMGKVELLGLI